ncbi:MAG: response regulator [Deltaproteobacteria bacterium]|nr:response regulator [Deltaproteobacteria bacterium]
MTTEKGTLKTPNPETPILVVDDDPVSHRVIRHHLKDWQLESVYSARDALDALEKENFVIVITDLIMPEMDGIDLLHEIKARYSNRVQVIVVTVSDQLDNLVKALDGGASDFLLKPLKKEDLEEVLEHTLSRIKRWNRTMNLLLTKKTTRKDPRPEDGALI